MIKTHWIKDKHPLVDLTKFGTRARKTMHPDVLIGTYPKGCAFFKEGDILDANATVHLALNIYEDGEWYGEIKDTIDGIHSIIENVQTNLTSKIEYLEKRKVSISYHLSDELLTIITTSADAVSYDTADELFTITTSSNSENS